MPASQVHPWPYLDTPQASADAYEQLLVSRFGGVNQVGFDVVLLGMGEDGHTASLFPGTAALSVRDRAAVANHVEKLDSWRLTMTYPVFENSRHVWFLACGAGKADIILPNVTEAAILSRQEMTTNRRSTSAPAQAAFCRSV